MTNLLKTFLHILSVVVLCSAMAACAPQNTSATYHGYEYGGGSASGSSSLFE